MLVFFPNVCENRGDLDKDMKKVKIKLIIEQSYLLLKAYCPLVAKYGNTFMQITKYLSVLETHSIKLKITTTLVFLD